MGPNIYKVGTDQLFLWICIREIRNYRSEFQDDEGEILWGSLSSTDFSANFNLKWFCDSE